MNTKIIGLAKLEIFTQGYIAAREDMCQSKLTDSEILELIPTAEAAYDALAKRRGMPSVAELRAPATPAERRVTDLEIALRAKSQRGNGMGALVRRPCPSGFLCIHEPRCPGATNK